MMVIPRCAILITSKGGPTCHAAIVSRQLGIPAIVGIGSTKHVALYETHSITGKNILRLSYEENEAFRECDYYRGNLDGTIVHWKQDGSVVFEKEGDSDE